MEKGTFLQEFVAGNTGGLLGIISVYPLDTAKTRMQTYQKYTGMYHVLNSMTKEAGVTSLYRGLPSPAVGFGLTFAVSFSAYGYCCRELSTYHNVPVGSLSLTDLFIAGALTGAIQSPCRAAFERVKSVMQVREMEGGKSAYKHSGACALELIRKEGIRNGLFQGFGSVLLREVPQFAVYYPSYEFLKVYFSDSLHFSPLFTQLLAGGCAGCIQWLPPIYCSDVIKSRMQTAPMGYYKNIGDCAARILKEEGVRVFFRGFWPAMLRAFPLHAIIFAGYEFTMNSTSSFFQT